MILILLFVSVLVSYLFAFRQIYQLQITEYRFDRFMTMLRDSGFGSLIFPKIVFPAKSIRNIMIAASALVFLLLLNYIFYLYFLENSTLIFILALLNYFIAKDLVFFVSIIVTPFANMARKRTIEQAREIVQSVEVERIGVTGSFGKSSVKEYIYQIFSEKYAVERTEGNRNTDIGVALEIKEKLKNNLDFFICEMGAYKIGEIERICDFVKPKYGILTGIGNQHMDLFGSIENLVQAKSELLRALPEDGIAVANIDNGYRKILFEGVKAKPITYGWSEHADYQILNLKYRKRLMFVEFSAFGKNYKFTTALLGNHQAVNLLGIIALALELKISYEVIQNAIAKMEPLYSKLSVHTGVNGATILNDGYNSNLNGFLSALKVAKNFEAKNKYAFNYGIFELGKEREKAYGRVVETATAGGITLLTLDKRFLKFDAKNVIYMNSEQEVMDFLKKNLQKEDLFLLEGRCTQKFLDFLDMKKYEVQD
jgi:UDP-N-acetylmuramoyl-tripeptide--D-alanyl-D-alanine ligase